MNTSDRVNVTLKLDRIDRDNFKCKVKNSDFKKMQYQLEYMVKQFLYGGQDVTTERTTKADVQASYDHTL